jgi:hypothetical protein
LRAPAAVGHAGRREAACRQRLTPRIYHSPGWYAYNAWYSLGCESARRHPSEAGHAGALPADTTRKGEFAMRDTWT